MGTWWEPAAALTCTPLVTTLTPASVLHKPCDIFKISEIEVQKLLAGLLPGPGTLSSSPPSFLVGLLPHARLRVPDQIVIAFVPKFGLYRFGGDPAHFPEFR